MPLRYGENPHQQAALYVPLGPHARGIAQAEQVQGKELSYNNLNDANAALELVERVPRRRADHRHRQACQSVRRRKPRHAARRVEAKRSPATAFPLSAASSRPTGRSTPRRPKRSPRSSPKSSLRRMPTMRRGRSSPQEEPPAAADRRASRSGARRPDDCGRSPAASWFRTATMAW